MLIPRPLSLTITRIGVPLAVAIAVATAFNGASTTTVAALAVAASGFSLVLGTRGEFARQCAQGAAYGDEERFPLKVPPGITFAVLPLALALIGSALTIGPLLLATRQWVGGGFALVLLLPAAFVARLIHQLSLRWVVLVPAGLVVADPLTLTDPVLLVRNRILGLGPADPRREPPAGSLDLRLGAGSGSCALLLVEDADLMRRVRNRSVGVRSHLILVTPTSASLLLARASARRIPVRSD